MPRSKAVAVLLSDIHYRPETISLCDPSFKQAVDTAAALGVPLYIPGDLNDTKAILRGECALAIINMLKYAKRMGVSVIVLVGNHDLINQHGTAHSLEFIRPWAAVIDEPCDLGNVYAIPYQSSVDKLREILARVEPGRTILMHQGVLGAHMGEYVVDKSSIPPAELADFRCISGHYHRAQNIKCGRPRKGAVGLFSYIGSPYSISFAEALDGPKGFQILHDDGILEQVPTNLRKHVIVEREIADVLTPIPDIAPGDLLWLKVKGPFSELEKLNKRAIGTALLGHASFKFDKISTDGPKASALQVEKLTHDQFTDHLIDASDEPVFQKASLKKLWREVMS